MAVFVLVENVEIIGWQSVSVVDAMDQIADSFNISTPNTEDPSGLYLPINPGDPVEIYEENDRQLVGWTDDLDTNISASDNTLSAKGRSLAGDLVDCSAEIKGGALKNVNALQIAEALAAPYNIPITVASGVDLGATFDTFTPKPGESCFQTLNRALQARSLLPSTVPATGGVELIKAKGKQATDDLIVGINCKLATGRWSVKDRFSEYRVLGQAPPKRKKKSEGEEGGGTVIGSVGTGGGVSAPKQSTIKSRDPKKTNRAVGISTDTEIERHRPKIIQAEKRTDSTEAEKRARWEATYRAGKSSGINLTVPRWRQQDGTPWSSNMLVRVTIPVFNLYDYEMLIKSRTLTYTVGGGSSVALQLVHPDTFTPPPQNDIQKGRNGSAWKQRKKKSGTVIASVGRSDAGEIINKGKQ